MNEPLTEVDYNDTNMIAELKSIMAILSDGG
jgi:hypothetical protein